MTRRPRARGDGPPKGRGRFSRAGAAGAILALVVVGVGAGALWAPGPPARDGGASTKLILPAGSGVTGAGRALGRAGVIRSPLAFMIAAAATGAAHHLQAGEYEFPAGASLDRVLSMIRSGQVVRRFVTIPEGYTARDVAHVLRATPFLSGEVRVPVEGSLLPETYAVRSGEPRAAVIRRMAAAREDLLRRLWSARPAGLPYESPQQAVILASVVEKETAKPDERPRIAAVFINRLRKGMRLESDPTVIYGLTGGAPLGHGLTESELAAPTPYNTYRVAGLPPGPIGNPGRAALAAALDPARTDDLFFVADGTGGHVFANTFEAHLRNVARWRAIERSSRRSAGA